MAPTTDTTTIVRDLAARGPDCDVVHGDGPGWRCRDCGAVDPQIVLASDSAIYRPGYHRAGCLWRRAVEAAGAGAWTPPAAQPASDEYLEG